MSRTVLVLLGCLSVAGMSCRKNVDISGTASDDEQLDSFVARLDELRSRGDANDAPCPGPCELAREACKLSKEICDISGRHPDRSDMQQRCVASQEDCARFNDGCSRC